MALKISWTSPDHPVEVYSGVPRNLACIDNLVFDSKLQPKNYEIAGTPPTSRILILDVNILDATGREPYRGDILIVGKSDSIRVTLVLGLLTSRHFRGTF